jgi:hypothetical protein
VRKASKDRGFRSEQAFILAACEREIRRGDDTESVTQFEARVRARLRYDKLIRAAAKELSNKNRDTLREMLADE